MITHIHSTTIVVSDQDKALEFYTKILGFEKALDERMSPEMRFLTVVPPGAQTQLVLGLASWFSGAGCDGQTSQFPGKHTAICMIAKDIDATVETLTGLGVKFKGQVEVMPWGSKAIWFYDLDDNEFFMVEG